MSLTAIAVTGSPSPRNTSKRSSRPSPSRRRSIRSSKSSNSPRNGSCPTARRRWRGCAPILKRSPCCARTLSPLTTTTRTRSSRLPSPMRWPGATWINAKTSRTRRSKRLSTFCSSRSPSRRSCVVRRKCAPRRRGARPALWATGSSAAAVRSAPAVKCAVKKIPWSSRANRRSCSPIRKS